jgi:glycosyltransferase involved in cell wall biosynthesis
MKLSLVIPCYNEMENIPLLLERCKEVSSRVGCEVILVDNGSTDDSSEVLRELLPKYPGCRSVRVERNQGYGFGILAGLESAKGEIIGWTHADMQTDPQDVLRGMEYFDSGGSNIFVKGQRYGRPLSDIMFTLGMSIFETILLRKPMRDINAQPTLFHRDFYSDWVSPPHDFSLDLYAYFMARKGSLRVLRFPVLFAERAHGKSHWNIDFSSKVKFIKRTLTYSFELFKKMKRDE